MFEHLPKESLKEKQEAPQGDFSDPQPAESKPEPPASEENPSNASNIIARTIRENPHQEDMTVLSVDTHETAINRRNTLMVVGVLIIVLFVLTGAGFLIVRQLASDDEEQAIPLNAIPQIVNTIPRNTNAVKNVNSVVNNTVVIPPVVNTNASSLCLYTDTTEAVVNPSMDTDGDTLLDGQEHQYGTSILNPDTDGDTYLDGSEVSSGYNPCGEGKL